MSKLRILLYNELHPLYVIGCCEETLCRLKLQKLGTKIMSQSMEKTGSNNLVPIAPKFSFELGGIIIK